MNAGVGRGGSAGDCKKFTLYMLIARMTIFHNSLIDIVKGHHKVSIEM